MPDHELVFAQVPGLYYRVLKQVTRHKVSKGSVIFKEGAPTDRLWAIAYGDISLTVKIDKGLSYIKQDVEIRRAERGALIGTELLANNKPLPSNVYTCSATALSPVALVYSFTVESLNEIKKRCVEKQWIQFKSVCSELLTHQLEIIERVKARAAKASAERKLPTTAIKLTDTKREYFIMGGRFRYLYKKEEIGEE